MPKNKEWDFGFAQLKAWIENDSLNWKMAAYKGTWKIDSISGIEFSSHALTSEIDVYVGGALSKKLNIPKNKKTEATAKDLINTIENMRKKTSSSGSISTADELKKFADLKAQGIITEEEFQTKKQQLLS